MENVKENENLTKLEYAEKRFKEEGLYNYAIKNRSNGHIHVIDKYGRIHQIWVNTGRFMFNPKAVLSDLREFRGLRGTDNFIKAIKKINNRGVR